MTWSCVCEFDPASVIPHFGSDWYAAHRDAHIAAFPDSDLRTRDNLTLFVEWAVEREAAALKLVCNCPDAASCAANHQPLAQVDSAGGAASERPDPGLGEVAEGPADSKIASRLRLQPARAHDGQRTAVPGE